MTKSIALQIAKVSARIMQRPYYVIEYMLPQGPTYVVSQASPTIVETILPCERSPA